MAERIEQIDVPIDLPYKHDALKRKPTVDFLTRLIAKTKGPFVLAIDAPWGSGKTTIVKMLEAELNNQQYQCVYFNAWEVDFISDPIVAMVSCLDQLNSNNQTFGAEFDSAMAKLRDITSFIARRGTVFATKVLTGGLVNVDTEMDEVKELFRANPSANLVNAFENEKILLEAFKSQLATAVSMLPQAEKKSSLIFIIDELDRCRPTFAIELLERVKHLFNLENIIFVLSIDKQQLEVSTKAIYGEGIAATEYLRKFIDVEFGLPEIQQEAYTQFLMHKLELDGLFMRRGSVNQQAKYEFLLFYTAFANLAQLSLRATEKCFTRLRIVVDQLEAGTTVDPSLTAILVILRTKFPQYFRGLFTGSLSSRELMIALLDEPNTERFLDEDMCLTIEAYFVLIDFDTNRKNITLNELTLKRRANMEAGVAGSTEEKLLGRIEHLRGIGVERISLRSICQKIDMAAQVRD